MSTPAKEKSGLQIRPLRYADPVVRALESELQQEYVTRYGGPDETPLQNGEFDPPRGLFLVGFVGAEPVASGGFRRHQDDIAEIKRMYVSHDHRGDGHARRLLAELEASALAAGYTRVVLTTGTAQAEAMALYESSGYVPTDSFGIYAAESGARFYGKDLPRS